MLLYEIIEQFLLHIGLVQGVAIRWAGPLVAVIVVILALLLYIVLKYLVQGRVQDFVASTSNTWDDALLETGVVRWILRIIPLTLVMLLLERGIPAGQLIVLKRVVFALIIFSGARAIDAFLGAFSLVYHQVQKGQRKPLRPLFQSLSIIIYLFSGIFIISTLLNREPWGLLSLLGGLTAVTMLVFKDTILGFVAGIQLGANDMVREGDWIEMPKYGADGDVIEVTVNTVKVRNWDKTITTIPTYALISDAFINWRGMTESGGRRIKRRVYIDMTSVRFADEKMLERFRRMKLVRDYVEQRQQEIDSFNQQAQEDLAAALVNGRRQTNLGVFRAYLYAYLRSNPQIHSGMTFLVRHLEPTPTGLPLEIYVFSRDQVWANYEAIQADIFDHILAAIPEFDLRVYQQPSGYDFRAISQWPSEGE